MRSTAQSPRHTRRFCAINCAALSDELLEAELFGHTRGAFTGAADRARRAVRRGRRRHALPRRGRRAVRPRPGEAAARAAGRRGASRRREPAAPRRCADRRGHEPSARSAKPRNGRFRTDLRFRLDVLRIAVPPLRDRIADIPLLAQHFWRQATDAGRLQATLAPDALAALSRYDWPGNVRELQNAIAWMAVHAPRRGRVSATLLPAQLAVGAVATGSVRGWRAKNSSGASSGPRSHRPAVNARRRRGPLVCRGQGLVEDVAAAEDRDGNDQVQGRIQAQRSRFRSAAFAADPFSNNRLSVAMRAGSDRHPHLGARRRPGDRRAARTPLPRVRVPDDGGRRSLTRSERSAIRLAMSSRRRESVGGDTE